MQSRSCQGTSRISHDVEPVAFFSTGSAPWAQLQFYNIYRLVLAGALLMVGLTEHLLPESLILNNKLYSDVIAIFTVIVIIENIAGYLQWPDYAKQIYLLSITDIASLLLIIYASGGVSFGIGILLVIPVIIPNLFRPGHLSLLLAAVTVIALFTVEVLSHQEALRPIQMATLTVLSFFLLISSWITSNWAGNVQRTAKLAKRQGMDLVNMSQVNQAVLDQLQMGVIVMGQDSHIDHMNNTAFEMLGSPKKWHNRSLKSFAPELDKWYSYWLKNHQHKISSYDFNHQEVMAMRARFVKMGARVNGTVLIYLLDTHEEGEKLQDLKLASLGQLTASIAHEIRNPLGAISHAAQLLTESDSLNSADTRLSQIIITNSKRMDGIIDTILNLSRRKNPTREAIHLKSWLNEFFDDFIEHTKLTKKQLSLVIEPSDLEIRFDSGHLHQIVSNLCHNAVRYAKKDSSKLSLFIQVGIPNHTKNVVMNVIDNGDGVPPDLTSRLFEPFNTTSTTGTGLGLFMCRELSQANGSKLEYIKLTNKGSCFRLSFANR
ncbi:MAG: HAMP domain-containing histidine kinase [Thiotrichaceae bacterium]|nr:HAMP domain-containing histidine kinase [Thiotrichaceae bacterium]